MALFPETDGGNLVEGTLLGLSKDETLALASGRIGGGSSNNTIAGLTEGARNVVAASGYGVHDGVHSALAAGTS